MDDIENKDIATNLKILKAAEQVFAEKGFDGARVDEIAKRAGVNKALIYYYFESKDQILEELSKKHLQEVIDLKESMLKGFDLSGGLTRELVERMIEVSLGTLLGERKDFMGIVLMEALKGESGNFSFYKLINQLYSDGVTRLNQIGYQIDNDKFQTLAFFFGMIPIVFYIIMGEKWAEYNGMDNEKVKTTFVEALTDIEFNLFLNKFNVDFNQEMLNTLYRDKFDFAKLKRPNTGSEK